MRAYFDDGTYIEAMPLADWPESDKPGIITIVKRLADTRSIQFPTADGFVVIRTETIRCLKLTNEEVALINEIVAKAAPVE